MNINCIRPKYKADNFEIKSIPSLHSVKTIRPFFKEEIGNICTILPSTTHPSNTKDHVRNWFISGNFLTFDTSIANFYLNILIFGGQYYWKFPANVWNGLETVTMICEGGGIQLRMGIFHFLPETHTTISTTTKKIHIYNDLTYDYGQKICGGIQT